MLDAPADETANMVVPEVVTIRMEGSNVVSAIRSDDFKLTVAIQIVHGDWRLNFAHLQRKTLAHLPVTVDNVYETNAGSNKNFQLPVAVEIGKNGVTVDKRSELRQVGGQIQMKRPKHGAGDQIIGNKSARNVVVQMYIRRDVCESFGILVVIFVKEVRHSEHNLTK